MVASQDLKRVHDRHKPNKYAAQIFSRCKALEKSAQIVSRCKFCDRNSRANHRRIVRSFARKFQNFYGNSSTLRSFARKFQNFCGNPSMLTQQQQYHSNSSDVHVDIQQRHSSEFICNMIVVTPPKNIHAHIMFL